MTRKGIARGHSSNFHILVSVGDLYIPTIDWQENMWTDPIDKYKSLTDT